MLLYNLQMEEKSIFVKTFGDYPLIKVLDFLLYSRDFDYPITEIAKNSEVNFQRFKKDNGKKDGVEVLLEEIETKLPEEMHRDQISQRNLWSFNGLDKRIFEGD